MNVYVNGVLVPFDDDKRTDELFRLCRELNERDEIVQTVMVDGVLIPEHDPDRLSQSFAGANEIRISTVKAETLVADLSAELRSYLPKVLRAFDSIPELLYGEMSENDWQLVAQLFEAMNWVSQSVFHLRLHAEKMGDAGRMDGLGQFTLQLAAQLADLERSLQESDFTAAGDLLKYEMPDTFNMLFEYLEGGDPA